MKETIRKQKLFLFSLIGVVVISFALLTTFAYQTLNVDLSDGSSDSLTVTSGVLDVKYTSSRTVSVENMALLNSYKSADYTEFEIDNTSSTEDVLYRLKLVDLSYSDNLTNGDFRYTIVRVDDNKETVISEDTFANLNENEYVFSTKYDNYLFIKSKEVQKLRIYFWLQETQNDQNYLEKSKFLGKIQVESIFSKDSLEKIIMNFKVYGNTLVENKNEFDIENQRNVRSLGELVTDTNDSNYGRYKIDLKVSDGNLLETNDSVVPYENKTYSIYLNKPLSCINDMCDYIDLIDNVVYRKIGYIKLSGKENWKKDNNVYSFNIKNIGDGFEPLSNSFKYNNDFNISGNLLSVNSDIDDINIFKSQLMSNNINIIYPLKDEETELISNINVSEFKEKNIVVTDGVIDSSNIVIEYNK